MPSHWSENIQDYNGETSVTGVAVGNVTAVSLPGLLTNIAAYRAAVDDLILGTVKSDTLVAYKTPGTNALPSDQNAQVERKWLVTYDDITQYFDPPTNAIPNAGFGKIFNLEIATANAELLADNQEYLDISAGPGLAYATAFNNMSRTPYGGVGRVLTVQLVGRTR